MAYDYEVDRFCGAVGDEKLRQLSCGNSRESVGSDLEDVCHGDAAAFAAIVYAEDSSHKEKFFAKITKKCVKPGG